MATTMAARATNMENVPIEVIVSATTRALVSSPDLAFTDWGEHELRGLEGTYRVYRLELGSTPE